MGASGALVPLLGMGPPAARAALGILLGTAGMLCAAFPVRGLRMLLKLLERLALYTFGLGGGLLFLFRLFPSARGAMASVPGVLGAGAVFLLLYWRFREGIGTGEGLCRAVLRRGGERAETVALIDSGNSLIEPISGKPVCVADRELYDRLWQGEEAGFRAVPYHSVGRKRGILRAYLLPELSVEAGGMEIRLADVYIAVADEGIGGADDKSVKMIIHPGLLMEGRGKGRIGRQNERQR